MSRALTIWLGCLVLSGCSHLQPHMADGPCDDCVPPAVAGKYFYHSHLDNLLTTCTAQKCAKRDLKQFNSECDGLTRDYCDGYTQAYIDLAAGRPACVPAVPPKKYWHAWHRSCAGRDAVDQWYAGYRNGLDNGVNSGVSRFNRIVPNSEGCCVSAAYVNPYATRTAPTGILPADGQTISGSPTDSPSEITTAAAIAPAEQNAVTP